ncbi:MAG: lipocalin-like domain-containing protein [Patescibacteria group bacterium]|nr:lipocalin-like domain-containing protein [Patescibacteria group bacterium]
MPAVYKPIEFPRDESVHNHIIEWWYFNGRLSGQDGGDYALMSCLFRADVKKVKIPFIANVPVAILYFYHSAISDISRGKFYPNIELANMVSEDSFSKPLLFINHISLNLLAGYTNCVIEETEKFVYHLKDKNTDLRLVSAKPPLLEGGAGFLDLKTKNTYYYSLTSLRAKGRIKVKNRWIEVRGKAWMDHQWANTAYSKDKWTWFSVQLDKETELVCFEYEDRGFKNHLISISYPDGAQKHFKEAIFTPAGEVWVSPKTKASYPLAWNIKTPDGLVNLTTRALAREQEMVFGSINYWEGPIEVGGLFGGREAKGQGFMELVGYESKYTNAKYVKDELRKTMNKFFVRARKNISSIADNVKTKIKLKK